jgi:hypothetical protein
MGPGPGIPLLPNTFAEQNVEPVGQGIESASVLGGDDPSFVPLTPHGEGLMLPIIIRQVERRYLGAAQIGDFEQCNHGSVTNAAWTIICAADG